jgi:CO/xanthine dehydrogenase Mo-binding subunit
MLYAGDLHVPNLLHGALVGVPCARAKIVHINVERAMREPDVVHIFTPADLPGAVPRFGPLVMDQPVLADGVTRYYGEPVACVVAEDEKAAREAARKVEVDYEELPAVVTFEQAMSANAPLIQDPALRPHSKLKHTNVMEAWEYKWGTLDSTECALIVENTYRAPFAHHFAIERPAAIGIPQDEGITILTPNQNPFSMRRVMAGMLDLPLSKVRIRSIDMGGAFGSKGYPKIEPAAALFSRMLRRPLKIAVSSEEAFIAAQREAAEIHIRTGFDKNGLIVFQDIDARFLVGAYTDISPRVIGKACFHATGPYRTPNARIKGVGLFTSTPPTTAYRGFGNTHTGMALEGQMTIAAHRLNLDQVELRLRNVAHKGETFRVMEAPADGDWPALLRKAADAIGWDSPPKKEHGRGIAFGMKASKPATVSNARVVLNNDASALVYVGTTEMGQGTRSVMSQIVSRSLGIPLSRIVIYVGDTAVVPFDTITAASRSVVNMGNALRNACDSIIDQLKEIVGDSFGDRTAEIRLDDGTIRIGEEKLTLAQVLKQRFGDSICEIIGEGTYSGSRDASHPLGGVAPFFEAVVTGVELRIDRETGQILLEKLVHASDVGVAINGQRAAGVDEGGNIMGAGLALSEQILYDSSGRISNGSSLDYRIPTIEDIPDQMTSIFQENKDGPGPFGSKGVGEGGILAVAPAICAAIFELTGVYFREIPVTSEKVWHGMNDRKF